MRVTCLLLLLTLSKRANDLKGPLNYCGVTRPAGQTALLLLCFQSYLHAFIWEVDTDAGKSMKKTHICKKLQKSRHSFSPVTLLLLQNNQRRAFIGSSALFFETSLNQTTVHHTCSGLALHVFFQLPPCLPTSLLLLSPLDVLLLHSSFLCIFPYLFSFLLSLFFLNSLNRGRVFRSGSVRSIERERRCLACFLML